MKDNGARDWVNQGNFITIKELRHNKLKDLGIYERIRTKL